MKTKPQTKIRRGIFIPANKKGTIAFRSKVKYNRRDKWAGKEAE